MDSNEYVKRSVARDADYGVISERLFMNEDLVRLLHAAIGLSGETGEIMDILKKSMAYGKEVDIEHLKEEIGDSLWYMAIMLDQLGVSFEDIMAQNDAKLQKRYPVGFTEAAAIARVDKQNEQTNN